MEIDDGKIALASALFAIAGILLLLLLSETPVEASAACALVSNENSLVRVSGIASEVSAEKFLLCNGACASVRGKISPILTNGREVTVLGRVKRYRDNGYIEAERIEIR